MRIQQRRRARSLRRHVSALLSQRATRWWALLPAPTSASESEAKDSNVHGRGCNSGGGSSEIEAQRISREKVKARRGSCLSVVVPVHSGSEEDPVLHAVKQRSLPSKESEARRHSRRINAKTLAKGIEESRRVVEKDAKEARAQILAKQRTCAAHALRRSKPKSFVSSRACPRNRTRTFPKEKSDSS
ncbi:hypothetical protein ZWY2020_040314 [Hordeum vulgare]|nr:hypothetical protein ZWY2020_040314 [Hordeum vulgare]